jgi:hypothetical protein
MLSGATADDQYVHKSNGTLLHMESLGGKSKKKNALDIAHKTVMSAVVAATTLSQIPNAPQDQRKDLGTRQALELSTKRSADKKKNVLPDGREFFTGEPPNKPGTNEREAANS